jgi:hypothetical protein
LDPAYVADGSKAEKLALSISRPHCNRKRTSQGRYETSASRHFRTRAPEQTASLFDDLVGSAKQHRRHFDAKRFGGLEVDR